MASESERPGVMPCGHHWQAERAAKRAGEREHVICFQCFRAAHHGVHPVAVQPELPFGRPLPLTRHQLEHRRRMLAHLNGRSRA